MRTLSVSLLALAILLLMTHTDSPAQEQSAKVYVMITVTVPLGKLPEYHALAEKELIPLQEKHGWRFTAGWQTIIGDIEETIRVAEFDNMDAYQKARVSFFSSPEWKALSPKFDPLSRGIQTRMLSALPYIKMK